MAGRWYTTGVAPVSHARRKDVSLRLRDDVVSESDRRAATRPRPQRGRTATLPRVTQR